MRAYERLLKYAQIYTTSDPTKETVPTTARQFDLARVLVEEMKALGIKDARVDDKCYVYGTIPATEGYENVLSLGLIAHLDTAPDCCGENVHPVLHENYDGGVIEIGNGCVLDPAMFPHLQGMVGETIISTDGTTLLGADDKGGIAAIMTLAEAFLSGDKKDVPHGKICIAFTPDEEVGGGAEDLDIPAFGADAAYTVDGGAENEIEYENFNAAAAKFEIKGRSVHPGDSKNRMINAALVACEINGALPACEIPAKTEGYEGFYHMTEIGGNVEKAEVSYIIRDHSSTLFDAKLKTLQLIEKTLNEKYGEGTVTLTIRQQYRNMVEKIRPCMHLVDNAKRAIEQVGLVPKEVPIRGGTDGACLSWRGLPCPNLGAGGYAFHGPYEHASVQGMDRAVQILENIVEIYAAQK